MLLLSKAFCSILCQKINIELSSVVSTLNVPYSLPQFVCSDMCEPKEYTGNGGWSQRSESVAVLSPYSVLGMNACRSIPVLARLEKYSTDIRYNYGTI